MFFPMMMELYTRSACLNSRSFLHSLAMDPKVSNQDTMRDHYEQNVLPQSTSLPKYKILKSILKHGV